MELSSLSWQEFELLCSRLLLAEKFKLASRARPGERGPDIVVTPPGQDDLWIVECKNSGPFVAAQARDTAHKLLSFQELVGASHGLLIVSSNLSPRVVEELGKYSNISIWDRSTLSELLRKHPNIEEEFGSLIQVKDSIRRRVEDPLVRDSTAAGLLEQLMAIIPGRENWRNYEDACIDILNYTCIPPFRTPRIQSVSEDGLDRRDAIYPISTGNPLWDRIQSECRTRMVVAEFKNLSDTPGQKEVESIQQYLYPKAMRSLGLLCARKPPDQAAIKARRRVWLEAGKLVILLSDEDLREMLLLRAMDENPAQVIDNQIDEFFVELCP